MFKAMDNTSRFKRSRTFLPKSAVPNRPYLDEGDLIRDIVFLTLYPARDIRIFTGGGVLYPWTLRDIRENIPAEGGTI